MAEKIGLVKCEKCGRYFPPSLVSPFLTLSLDGDVEEFANMIMCAVCAYAEILRVHEKEDAKVSVTFFQLYVETKKFLGECDDSDRIMKF